MSIATEQAPPQTCSTTPQLPPFLLSLERYERLAEAGILSSRDKVYLWKGVLVAKMTKNPPHVIAQSTLNRKFSRLVPDEYFVQVDAPVVLPNAASAPEPDLAIIRGEFQEYNHRKVTARDAVLVVEVSDSSLVVDRRDKLPSYSAESIPAYWIVNIPDRRIEVYTDPTGPVDSPTYRSRRDYAPGEAVPLILDGREIARIAVDDILV